MLKRQGGAQANTPGLVATYILSLLLSSPWVRPLLHDTVS